MNDVLLFGGTTEGRKIAEAFANTDITLHVCVATEYGEALLSPAGNIHIMHGRKNRDEIVSLIKSTNAALIIDATHPYAEEVTKTVKNAAQLTNTELVRIVRERESADGCIYVKDTEEATEYLNSTSGNILLTVGSKELSHYTQIKDCAERVFARILPLPEAVESAHSLGFSGSHLLCMQGPFSEEFNVALIKQINAKYVVTKDTGAQGGFSEKISAAKKCGAVPVVISRPTDEDGISCDECIRLLSERFSVTPAQRKNVTVIGIGMGDGLTLTQAAKDACEKAELIIGAKRVTDALSAFGKSTQNAVSAADIERIIRESSYTDIVAAMSGDSGFYSGTKTLLKRTHDLKPVVIPGISSVSYLAAKLRVSWDDAKAFSIHGRDCNIINKLSHTNKAFILVGGENGAGELMKKLCEYGMGDCSVSIGENLSYENEKITQGRADELADAVFSSLAVVYVENENVRNVTTHGYADDEFIRGDVPMTKQEIRAVTLAKMRLSPDSVVWDVGAGTGSVSVEAALCAYDGKVYAIEKNEAACELINENAHKFACDNITVIKGAAPEALQGLPSPTHAFIGGSGGNMKEIISFALSVNPKAKIVINTVTIESLSEAVQALSALPIKNAEYTEINASRSRELGRYHLMTAQNPVYIISCEGAACED